MDPEGMKQRTKEFAKRVINLCRHLPAREEARLIGGQLFRAGTSVGANYRASCRARSKADFVAKLGIVLEEADESLVTVHGSKPRFFCGESGDIGMSINHFRPSDITSV